MAQKTTVAAAPRGAVHPAAARGVRVPVGRSTRAGFTLVEMMITVLLVGVAAAVVVPAVGRLRAEASVRGGGAELTVGVAQARALAVRYGRPSVFLLDTATSTYRVLIDTTLAEVGADTLVVRELPELAGVVRSTSSDPAMVCFDGRGVGRSGGGCGAGLVVVLAAGGWVDTVAFTATGRLIR